MKRFLKYAALIATVLMVSSSAWAFDGANHIAQAPNNKGDALIFPWFLALDGGWQTKMTVINTDTVNSVVAKVVARSFNNSEELLDFLIYLSPGDVWTGSIYFDATNGVSVYSDDDSIVVDADGTFATKDNPFNYPMFPVKCTNDGTYFGYVEVIEAAIGPVKNGNGVPAPGVDKKDIYGLYNPAVDTEITPPLYLPYVALLGDPAALPDPILPGQVASVNVLAGFMDFGNPTLGLNTTYSATTLRDYVNMAKLPPEMETIFGVDCNNSMGEIEAALSKNNIAMPYVNGSDIAFHLFTFPTKESTTNTACDVTTSSPYYQQQAAYASATHPYNYCVKYTPKNFDLQEHSKKTPVSGGEKTYTFCQEVNILAPNDYAEGWSQYLFPLKDGVTATVASTLAGFVDAETPPTEVVVYDGSPVIPTFMYIGSGGLTGGYGAYTNGLVGVGLDAVAAALAPIDFYQYIGSVQPPA